MGISATVALPPRTQSCEGVFGLWEVLLTSPLAYTQTSLRLAEGLVPAIARSADFCTALSMHEIILR